jgi:hypothetical protein
VCLRLVSSIPPLKHGEIVCFNRADAWLTGCEATHKEVMELWHENCKLIWKYETDMKISNWYENIKRPRRNHTSKGENLKLIWKYETDMKISNVHVGTIHRKVRIWNWYENMKLIWKYETDMKIWNCSVWYSHVSVFVPTWMFDIFILDAAGMKIHLAGIKTRSQRKNGLPSSYVDICNFQYGDSGNENLFRRKNVSVGLQRG